MLTDRPGCQPGAGRVILHCDCNNFFASVELLKFPELRDKPVAVAGDPEGRHGIILAKNMAAKRYGVQTAETVWQARRKCPELILLPPHHDEYAAMSRRVNDIYLSVTDQVEPFSVDESWLGKQGESLYAMVNGLDDAPVRCWGEGEAVKSVGNGMTFPHDLIGEEAWKAGLMPLCDSVGSRLRAQHLKCRTITVQIKDPQLKVISRQKTLPMPTSLTKVIFREALGILRQCWHADAPIRLLTVTASSLCAEEESSVAQLSFLAEVKPDDPRQAKLEQAVDDVRKRFGKSVISPGTIQVE